MGNPVAGKTKEAISHTHMYIPQASSARQQYRQGIGGTKSV